MLSLFQEYITQQDLFDPKDRILLAVSGGMDSIAMTELFHQSGFDFGIAHCNFSLRGKESDEDEEFVRNISIHYGVYFHVKKFDTRKYAAGKRISLQMAARELRYAWFRQILSEYGYSYAAVAHHRDDEVETFLINLSRGTGIAGLHGILPKKEGIIRPLLFASRETINQFVQMENLSYREDSSNQEDKYLRNRIRHRILPELDKAAPDFREQLIQTISNIREAEEIYQQALDEKMNRIVRHVEEETRIKISELQALNPLKTWAYEFLKPYGFNAFTVESIIRALGSGTGKTFLSPEYRLVIDREDLIITKNPRTIDEKQSFFIYDDKGEMNEPIGLSWKIVDKDQLSFSNDNSVAFLDLDSLDFPLEIRKWKQGDYFYPLGMDRRKKLSDYFIDQKLSIPDKEKTWLLTSGGNIAWIIGHRADDRFKVRTGTAKVLMIRCTP